MTKRDTLIRLGLTPNAATIYLSLVGSGPRTVAAIARVVGLYRPAVYRALPSLEKLGLVTQSPRGKRVYYAAESPQKLTGLVSVLQNELEQALPSLLARYGASTVQPVVTYGEGKRAITSVLRDLVTSMPAHGLYYRYSSNVLLHSDERHERYFPREYYRLREEKQLERFVITNAANKRASKQFLTRAIKAVPERSGLFEYNITQLIYGDKVAFIDYNTETALVVENKQVAAFQKKLFQLLYERL